MAAYPEHDKLAKVASLSQACGEFLEWLQNKGYVLARWCEDSYGEERLSPVYARQLWLLSEFFNIDQDKLEAEKQAMLEKVRAAQKRS